MEFGILQFCTEYTLNPIELGRALEERGFDRFLVPEHSHIPTSRASPFPAGGPLPEEYKHTLDPFVILAAVAAVTKRLKVGTGVCLVMQRDPIHTAKEVASLDWLSGGRFLFGIGAGWNREEMAHHGTEFDTRFALLRERVEAMKAIWRDEVASYHGRYVQFESIWQWPKPIQKPHPPILVGGHGPKVFERIVRYGDEWLPIGVRGPLDEFKARFGELQDLAKRAGRDPIPVGIYGCPAEEEAVAAYIEAGVSSIQFWMPSCSPAETERHLERYTRIKSKFT
jgi:probable F420-dependent oxidoreductase